MKMRSKDPSPEAIAVRNELLAVLKKHGDKLSQEEILAMLSYTVGQTIAVMDQTKYTSEMCMEIVGENLEKGNADAVSHLFTSQAGQA